MAVNREMMLQRGSRQFYCFLEAPILPRGPVQVFSVELKCFPSPGVVADFGSDLVLEPMKGLLLFAC